MSKRCVDKIWWVSVIGVWGGCAGALFAWRCYGTGMFIAVVTVAAWLRLAIMERNDDRRLEMHKQLSEHFRKRFYESENAFKKRLEHERSSRTKQSV